MATVWTRDEANAEFVMTDTSTGLVVARISDRVAAERGLLPLIASYLPTRTTAPASAKSGLGACVAPSDGHRSEENMTQTLKAAMDSAAKEWADVRLAIRHARRVLLWGPPGTGKSFIAAKVPGNRDLFRLYLTMDTPAAEVRGHYLPNEKGGFQWHDGPGISAWRVGGRLNIDEIDAASGDTLTLLMGLLDDPDSARLTLPTNETVRPHTAFTVVATTNQQPTVMPEALLDRFDVVLHVPAPDPEVFTHADWYSATVRDAAARAVYLEEARSKTSGRNIGLRAFRAIDGLNGKGVPLADAARLVLGRDTSRWLLTALQIAA